MGACEWSLSLIYYFRIKNSEIRTCIHRRGMPDGRGILPPCKAKIAGILCVLQDFLTKQGGKRLAQMAFNACEYRF